MFAGLVFVAATALAGDPAEVQVTFEADRKDLVVSVHSTSTASASIWTVGYGYPMTTETVMGLCTMPCTVSLPARIRELGVDGKTGVLAPSPVELRGGNVTLMAHTLDARQARRQRMGAWAMLTSGVVITVGGLLAMPADEDSSLASPQGTAAASLVVGGTLVAGASGLRALQLKRKHKTEMYWEVKQGDARAH